MALCSLAPHILILEKSIKSSCGKSVQTLRQTFEGGCIVSAGGNMWFSLKTEKRVWHIKVKGHCIQGLDMLNNLPPSPQHTHTHTNYGGYCWTGTINQEGPLCFFSCDNSSTGALHMKSKAKTLTDKLQLSPILQLDKKKCLFFLRLLMFWLIIRRLFKTNHMTPCCHICGF